MAESRSRDRWNHTSAILAMLANVHRDPKKSRKFKPRDFHPDAQPEEQPLPSSKSSFTILRAVFVRPNP